MPYLKQLFLSVCFTSTVLLWGTAFGFSNEEIMIAAIAIGVIQWSVFMENK